MSSQISYDSARNNLTSSSNWSSKSPYEQQEEMRKELLKVLQYKLKSTAILEQDEDTISCDFFKRDSVYTDARGNVMN